MGALLFVLCGTAMLLRGGLLLRLARLFRPDTVMGMVSSQQKIIGRKLLAMARDYGGLKVDLKPFRGLPLPPVFLMITNHQSLAEIAALSAVFPRHGLRFVAKKELGRWVPYVSINLRLGRHAVISRTSDYRQGHRLLTRFADLAREGYTLVVFPEGRRSRTGAVQPFFAGAVRVILERAPLPVLSVAIDGGYRISRARQLLTNVGRTRYRVKPLALHPAPHGKREILEVLSQVEKEIRTQVDEWRAEERQEAARAKKNPS